MKRTTTTIRSGLNSTCIFSCALIVIFFITAISAVNAQSATALKFDGADDYVALPDITSSFTTGQVSGEAWIYANSLPSWGSIMKNWTENTQGMFHFGADAFSSVLSIYIGEADGNAVSVSSSLLLEQHQWYHVAFSADGSILRLFVNGNEVGFAPYDGTLATGVSATFLGAKPGDSGTSPASSLAGYWDGYMDEVRIWNRGLSQAEIQDHMNCELSDSETGLVAYYKMNQGIADGDNTSEIFAADASGNNNNAALTNFSLAGSSSNWTAGVIGTAVYYADADGDGYGDASVSTTVSCLAPAGYVMNSLDCNDADNTAHPGAAEACNELDDDCDGAVDESCGLTYTYYFDGDGDGYGKPDFPLTTTDNSPPPFYSTVSGDCNDGNSATHPGAAEVCDGVDNNCDGTIDESCVAMYTFYYDGDADGYGSPIGMLTIADSVPPASYVINGDDCNDGNPTMHPGAADPCNYLDDDCNGITDEGCGPLNTYYFDSDYDGYGTNDFAIHLYDASPPPAFAALGGDCDNYNAFVNPGKIEVCNGIDDNCSGAVDDDCVPIVLPDFTKSDINGVTHHLFEDLSAGNAVILEFSTGWCGPSLYTEPKISKVYDDICQGQGNIKLYDLVFETDVYGIVSDDAFGSHYANRHNITYPVITGSNDVFSAYASNYGNYNIPWFLLIIPDTADPQNSTVHQIIGDELYLTDSIEHLLIAGGYPITYPEELSISVSGDVCDLPSPVTLTSSAETGNLWSTGDTTQSITITAAGEYYLYHEADCGIITKKLYIGNLVAPGILSLPSGSTTCSGTSGLFQLEYTGTPATIQYSTDSVTWADFSLNFSGSAYFGNYWSTGTTIYFRSISTNENSSVLGNCEVYSNVVKLHVEELETKPHITVIDSSCSFPITLQSFSAINNIWSTGDTTESITVTTPDYYYVIAPQTCGLAFAITYIWNADAMTWYADTDNDGYGDPENSIESCSSPEGYTDNSGDCDDTKNTVHPYALDICNGIDDDCSGSIDDGGELIPVTGNITGSTKVCAGDESLTYTVEASENALYYIWYLDTGITSTTGSLTTTENFITLDFGSTFTGGSVSVQAMNDCGSGEISTAFHISRYTAKPSTPAAINSLTGLQYGYCGNSSYTFTTTSNANAASFNWTASAGTIITGQGTNTVTIKLNPNYSSCKITVSAKNCLGISRTRSLTLKSAPVKPVIAGPSSICRDTEPTVTYNVSSAGAVLYTWSSSTSLILFSDGGTPSNPLITNSSSVTVDVSSAPAGARKIRVVAANDCGSTKPFNKTITVGNCTKEGEIIAADQQMSFSMSPNPARDMVMLSFENSADGSCVSVTSELGEIVLAEVMITGDHYELNCADLPAGMYIVQVKNNNETAYCKLVIER